MTEKQIEAQEKELQNYIRMHPRLNLEFKAMMSRLLREHRIDISVETLSRMTIALVRNGADEGVEVKNESPKDGSEEGDTEHRVDSSDPNDSPDSNDSSDPDLEESSSRDQIN